MSATQVVANSSEEVAVFYSQSGSAANACLTVHLRTPASQTAPPTVQFRKRGALNSDELAAFAAVLRTANLVTADKAAAAAKKAAAAKATLAAEAAAAAKARPCFLTAHMHCPSPSACTCQNHGLVSGRHTAHKLSYDTLYSCISTEYMLLCYH